MGDHVNDMETHGDTMAAHHNLMAAPWIPLGQSMAVLGIGMTQS